MWGTPEEMLESDPNVFCGKTAKDIVSESPKNPSRRFTHETLSAAKELLHERSELCGIVLPSPRNKNILEIDILNEGPYINDGEIGSCVSTNKWINFHTHPYVVWPWPSTEDIFKVLRHRPRRKPFWGSIIFTEWGIWEIFSPHKIDDSTLKDLKHWATVEASDKLYYDLGLNRHSKVPKLKDIRGALKDYMNFWSREFGDVGLEITLTPWEKGKDYHLQTGLQDVPL